MESKNKFATQNFVKGCHTLEQKNGPDFSLTSHGSKKSCPVAQNRWIFLLDKSFKSLLYPKGKSPTKSSCKQIINQNTEVSNHSGQAKCNML